MISFSKKKAEDRNPAAITDRAKSKISKPILLVVIIILAVLIFFIGNVLNNWTMALKERSKVEYAAKLQKKIGPPLSVELTQEEEKEISTIIKEKLTPPETEVLKEELRRAESAKISAEIEALRTELAMIRETKETARDEVAKALKVSTIKIEDTLGQKLDILTKKMQDEIAAKGITKEEFNQLRGSIEGMKEELRTEIKKVEAAPKAEDLPEVFFTATGEGERELSAGEVFADKDVPLPQETIVEDLGEKETPAVVPFAVEAIPPRLPGEYVINPGDLIEVSVYEEPDLSKTVKVSPQGDISDPLLGRIKLAGLSISQAESRFRRYLERDYLANPQITIFVREYGKISILGAVNKPGSYQLKASLTLLDAVALAEGFSNIADLTKVKVIRSVGGNEQTLYVNVSDIT